MNKLKQDKIFECHTKGCKDGCEEAPGWCDVCLAMESGDMAEKVAKVRFGTKSETVSAPPVSALEDRD